MDTRQTYEALAAHSKEIALLRSTAALLAWDQRTHIPRNGHAHRVEQISLVARLVHNRVTDPRRGEWLAAVEGSELTTDPESVEAVNIREWRRSYDRMTKIPGALAVEIARAAAEGQSVWQWARPENDWARFLPYLERIVDLKREEASALGFDGEPYDALLDAYERAETFAGLKPVFEELSAALVPLIDRIRGCSVTWNRGMDGVTFPRAVQEGFGREVAKAIGYNFDGGRLDVSAHPFTTGIGPGDVRITTRYREAHFGRGFFAIVHEAGHALYHQGLPMEHWGTPLCAPISLGINESQSRMWENVVARSEAFWRHFYPMAQERFTGLRDLPMTTFLGSMNEVCPSLIRTEADEVTYNLHVMLRFDIEVALMRADLEPRDLPEAWTEKMRAYLGLTPPDYTDGVMQDVHWSGGSIGYFPTYTLGNLYAAQFFAQVCREIPDIEEQFARGEFVPLREWLREKIHSQGSRYLPRDLLKRVTGEDLNPAYLIEYLQAKCGTLYGI
ncbi:MAG: carboxypeptidase M32 [Thermodesulfobacteriota bacterium]